MIIVIIIRDCTEYSVTADMRFGSEECAERTTHISSQTEY